MEERDPWNPQLNGADPCPVSEDILAYQGSESYVYLIKEDGRYGAVKIGTGWNPALRLRTFQVGNPRRLRLVAVLADPEHVWEQRLHTVFNKEHIRGEWFRASPLLRSAIQAWKREESGEI